MADPLVGQGFSNFIGTRTQPGQTQVEFYNTQNSSQPGFSNPQDLANYASTLSGRSDINAGNVFDVLKQGFTPRAQALDQIKQDLNSYQQETFNSGQPSSVRKSSSITDSINTEQNNYNTYLDEYTNLKKKLEGLQAPNFQQSYTDLRTAQGVSGLESDYANNQKTIRELPYVNRMASGNAGVMTEGQLTADTAQKGIPLEIQQANLIDRLKLANDFITNSLNLKGKDYDTASSALKTAADIVANTINLSHTHLNDLLTQQKTQQERDEINQKFAFENRIAKPFYDISGTVYRTSDRMPAHNKAEYVSMGGTGDFSDVQKISPKEKPVEVSAGGRLVDPVTGKEIYTAPAKDELLTPDEAAKLGVPYGTTRSQAAAKGITPLTNANQIDPKEKFQLQLDLKKNFDSITATSRIAENSYNEINTAYTQALKDIRDGKSLNASSQAVIVAFNKLIDPTSVVRESEYARTPEGQSLINRISGKITQLQQGGAGLTPADLKGLVTTANELVKGFQATTLEQARIAQQAADKYGLDVNLILPKSIIDQLPKSSPVGTLTPIVGPLSSQTNPILKKYPYQETALLLHQYPDATEQEIGQALGLSKVGSDTNKATARTDRHNNPVAFTTDIAKQAGLQLGVDYTIGDAFPNNPNLKTAKLIGDPIAQTIKVIDRIGFYTQSGQPRWTYVSALKGASNWKNLSYAQKKQVIAQMYSHEGGSALKQYFA
jgi:hypothetical protein